MPRVSVLMTTYGGAALIRASIESALAQDFPDFELVVVDDASVDGTAEILAGYDDPRLVAVRLPRNLGIVGARNVGLTHCRGPYVAALDHDDLCLPGRLAQQAAFLDANPGVVMVGSAVRLLDGDRDRPSAAQPALSPLLLRWLLLVSNPLPWSSVMLRRAALDRLGMFMHPDFELADDFELYHRLLGVGDLARMEAVLAVYRFHPANSTSAHAPRQSERAAMVLARAYAPWLGDDAPAAAALVVSLLVNSEPAMDAAALHRLQDVLCRLLSAYGRALDPGARAAVAASAGALWWQVARSAVRRGVPGAAAAYLAPAELAGFRPARGDWLASRAVGLLRRLG